MHNEAPFNPLPPAVLLLALAIGGIELVFWFSQEGLIGNTRGGADLRVQAIERFAYPPDYFRYMAQTGDWRFDGLMRFVTYPFVHVTFTQTIFVVVFVLALGKMVGEAFSSGAVLVIFFGSAVAGALLYTLLLNDTRPLIGGFPSAYGLIGGYTFLLWIGLAARGENQAQAFSLIALLMGIQLLFGLFFGTGNDWVADLGGFAAGFVLSGVLSPGGWRRIFDWMRSRS